MGVKQVIVMRTDTDPPMRKGKMIAQGAHASCAFLIAGIMRDGKFPPDQCYWMKTNFRKVCVRVDSCAELLGIRDSAAAAGVEVHVITDDGLTEFKEPTITCLAIGPDDDDKINAITGHLKLL